MIEISLYSILENMVHFDTYIGPMLNVAIVH